jgi:transcription antitermination factor NusG
VLAPEMTLYPETLLSDWAPTRQDSGNEAWYVLHTRPRAEKTVARKLCVQNVGFFLPTLAKPLASRAGKQASQVVMFPGYVFLHGDAEARLKALETNLLVQCIAVKDQAALHDELTKVHTLMHRPTARVEVNYHTGQKVMIASGPLEGMRGRWLKEGTRGRFVVEVQMLRQGVSVELAANMVRPVEV